MVCITCTHHQFTMVCSVDCTCFAARQLLCRPLWLVYSYRIVQNLVGRNLSELIVLDFGEENVGKFTIANISYFSESGIWLGKILANGICYAKFAKVFPSQNFVLWCKCSHMEISLCEETSSYWCVFIQIRSYLCTFVFSDVIGYFKRYS